MKYFLVSPIVLFIFCLLLFSGTFRPGDSEGTLGTGNMSASSSSNCVDVSRLEYIGLQFQHTNIDAVDGTLKIIASVRANASVAADYDDYPSSSQNINVSAAGSYWWDIHTRSLGKVCVSYSKGSNTTGTYTIYFRKEVPGR